MSIGLTGAHRTGKSTLAAAAATRMEIPFVAARTIKAFEHFGFHVDQALDFEDRLRLQELILDYHIADITAAGMRFITDRTPLDFAAYMMAEWGKSATSEQSVKLMSYIDRCLLATARHYGAIIQVRPGIPYVAEEGKPAPSLAFQQIIHMLVAAFMDDDRVTSACFTLLPENTSLESRVESVIFGWHHLIEVAKIKASGATIH